jgi:hypothetical protein
VSAWCVRVCMCVCVCAYAHECMCRSSAHCYEALTTWFDQTGRFWDGEEPGPTGCLPSIYCHKTKSGFRYALFVFPLNSLYNIKRWPAIVYYLLLTSALLSLGAFRLAVQYTLLGLYVSPLVINSNWLHTSKA